MNYTVKFHNDPTEVLSHLISMYEDVFFKKGDRIYSDFHGNVITENTDDAIYYDHERTLIKNPTKKWCIENIKRHYYSHGRSLDDDCIISEPFYSLAQELVEKFKL